MADPVVQPEVAEEAAPKTVHHVPIDRFREVATERAAFKAEAEKATARAAELEKAHASVAAELARTRFLHASDVVMTSAARDLPDLAEADVRGFLREQYERVKADGGAKAPEFGEWFEAQRKAPSRLLRPYLTAPAAEPAEAKEAPKEAPKAKTPPERKGVDAAGGGVVEMTDDIAQQYLASKPLDSDEYKRAEAYLFKKVSPR